MKKWLSIGLLALGLSLFGHGVYMQAKAWLAQVLIEQAWQTTFSLLGMFRQLAFGPNFELRDLGYGLNRHESGFNTPMM